MWLYSESGTPGRNPTDKQGPQIPPRQSLELGAQNNLFKKAQIHPSKSTEQLGLGWCHQPLEQQ